MAQSASAWSKGKRERPLAKEANSEEKWEPEHVHEVNLLYVSMSNSQKSKFCYTFLLVMKSKQIKALDLMHNREDQRALRLTVDEIINAYS